MILISKLIQSYKRYFQFII